MFQMSLHILNAMNETHTNTPIHKTTRPPIQTELEKIKKISKTENK